jgi:hypothetical protein
VTAYPSHLVVGVVLQMMTALALTKSAVAPLPVSFPSCHFASICGSSPATGSTRNINKDRPSIKFFGGKLGV